MAGSSYLYIKNFTTMTNVTGAFSIYSATCKAVYMNSVKMIDSSPITIRLMELDHYFEIINSQF